MDRKKNLLLIIDMQHDFCHPEGTLFVPGAVEDATRLAGFINTYSKELDNIILTFDSHHVIDISHPAFWTDKQGNNPSPFTRITTHDIENERWSPLFFKDDAKKYIKKLDENGEYPHVIWPYHCILGSKGASLEENVFMALLNWSGSGKYYEIIQKGLNPLTEHFGALRATIPIDDDPETQVNTQLVNKLLMYDNIYIAGEAKSHCVANTVKQLLEIKNIPERMVIIEDCTSNVPGFEDIANPIYANALQSGARILKSTYIRVS